MVQLLMISTQNNAFYMKILKIESTKLLEINYNRKFDKFGKFVKLLENI